MVVVVVVVVLKKDDVGAGFGGFEDDHAAAFVGAEKADVVVVSRSVVFGVVVFLFSSPSRHGFWTAKGDVHSTVRTDV